MTLLSIERAHVAQVLAVMEAILGRSVTYARARLRAVAYELDEPYRSELLAGIEEVYDGGGPGEVR